jgi:hypothetical protein
MEEKSVKLVQALKKGKGVVGIVAFDLGQAPFANWNNNTAFVEKLLEIINPELTATTNNINDYLNISYSIRNAMNQFSEMATAKTSSFYLILFIYVLVVAPLSYIILKKIDKRELMWITVPALAIIFGIIVYITGSGTRLSEITTNVVSYISLDEKGNASTSTYAGIFNSNKMKVKVVGKNGEKFLPLSNDNYHDSNQPVDNEVMEAKIFATQDGGVEYRNSSLLETKVLQIQESSKNIGKIESDISLKNGSIIGNIKNSTKLDLVDCLIIMPSGYYKIDSLKSGESVKIDNIAITNYGGGNIHEMIQEVFFRYNRNTSNMKDTERKKFLDQRQEGAILQDMFNNGNGQVEDIKFIAFSKTQIHNPLIINGSEAKKNERNILNIPLNLNFTNGENIEYPMGFIPFEISGTSTLAYDQNRNSFFGNGSAELLFNIDKNMKVEEIEISNPNQQTTNTTTVVSQGQVTKTVSTQAVSPNNSDYYIFNLEKNSYETFKIGVIKGDNLKKYLSLDNIVKIKLEVKDADTTAPQMAARGRKK